MQYSLFHAPTRALNRRLVPVAGLLVTLQAVPAAAQRVTVSGVFSRGDRAVTHSAAGISARLTVPVLPVVGFAVGYSRLGGRSDVDASPCTDYWPEGTSCVDERLRNNLQFGTVDYELYLPIPLPGFDVTVAGGVDVTTIERATLRGVESGAELEAFAPDGGVWHALTGFNGYHYSVSLGFSPLVAVPLTLRAAWQHRVMDLDACSATSYSPFCGEMQSNELLLGFSIGTR